MIALSLEYYDEIHIDHPFYYAIVKIDENQVPGSRRVVPLFAGIVAKPEI